MPLSNEMRRLRAKWVTNNGWPKRLDWIEIKGLRGWGGQRFSCSFPIMAVVGENGSGKSTLLQCAAAVYRPLGPPSQEGRFASDFFPDTPWEIVRNAEIRYAVREGNLPTTGRVRKPGERWRGNPERRERNVVYIDLSRIQPVPARVGYSKLAKAQHVETGATEFDQYRLGRLSQIMGRHYELAKMALTDADIGGKRPVPVLAHEGAVFSGFHQGAGETTIAELLAADLPRYSLVLIDEIESSLHPRSQRRLIRDLAERCRERELQIIMTTHSPYVLDELPLEGRAYILESSGTKDIVYGASPDFAMTKMDDQPHYECDLYVEDERATVLVLEILAAHAPLLVQRCQTIAYGAGSVGKALGTMVAQKRFPRPSCVFLDGDMGESFGCIVLPGDDPPERVIFEGLRKLNWGEAATRTGRPFADFADACGRAMTLDDHHEWIGVAATRLVLSGDTLWQALCAEWAGKCLSPQDAAVITEPIEDALIGSTGIGAVPAVRMPEPVISAAVASPPTARSPRPARSSVVPQDQDDLFSPARRVGHPRVPE
jgi:predicted ATPase